MLANTADLELDALVAFNRVDFPDPGGLPSVPDPSSLLLLGLGIVGLAVWQWKRQGTTNA